MLRMLMIPIAAITIAASSTAPTPQGEVKASMDASAAGWNAGDLGRFVAIYGADAILVTAKGLVRGRDAIAAHYRASFVAGGNARGVLAFELLSFRTIDPTHQLLFARWRLTPLRSGAKIEQGMTTLLFERQRGGWKIVADHSS